MRPLSLKIVTPLLLLAVLYTAHSIAATRNCTGPERSVADTQLFDIQGDSGRQTNIASTHLPHGEHTGTHPSQANGVDREVLLFQDGYVLKYDSDLRTGLWVSYHLTKGDINNAGPDRVECFRRDVRLPDEAAAVSSDFDEPIFDQGHLANDADLKDDLTEQINTYVLSNMAPQYCRFNRGIWLSLEHLGRIWAVEHDSLFITSGAVFDFNPRDARDRDSAAGRMGSRNQRARVAIASHFYKIFLRQEGAQWQAFSVMLEHNNTKHGRSWNDVRQAVESAMVTIEDIEARTDVMFHPELDRADLVQNDLSQWSLAVGKTNMECS